MSHSEAPAEFDSREVESLVAKARAALREDDACPAPEGWSVDTQRAMALLAGFPSLGLTEGYTLVTFQFRRGANGHGETWAVPAETVDALDASLSLEPTLTPSGHRSPEGGPAPGYRMPRPIPPGGVRDFMTVVRGDGTPWSYVSASFFAREAEEIGAEWHGAGWSWHALMGTEETEAIAEAVAQAPAAPHGMGWDEDHPPEHLPVERWEVDPLNPPPRRYDVSVTFTGPWAEVTFYTHASLGQERIERHRDRYARGGYEFTTSTMTLAVGPGIIIT